ncbi:glycosyltransferase family 2 protein [Bacillus mycoides]|uniref:glycosyltransferase family 2 protein n=1 Tax=Bacillus mycoides TaxID=1405 RepID=UPI001C01969D|nr:glycosyltransferase [Bacillus mycoides]QWI52123.1 glycosyltransferase [Bacillus mycoides]
MSALVSICTPVYNHELYLEDYFKSITKQTYKNIELILINDNSTDNSHRVILEWMNELENRFSRVTYINRTVNKGLIYNCNQAIELSMGEYIYIFASDDMMHETNIEFKVSELERDSEIGLVYSDGFIIKEKASIFDVNNNIISRFSEEQNLYKGNVFQELIDFGSFIPAPSVLLRKSILEELGGYSSDYVFEDYQMWLKIAFKYKIALIEQPLIYYRLCSGSLSREPQKFIRMIRDQEKLLLNLESKFNNIDISRGLHSVYSDGIKGSFNYNLVEDFRYYYNKFEKKSLKYKIKNLIISIPLIYWSYDKLKGFYKKIRV